MKFSCSRLGLTSLAYLWRRDQKDLLYEMANAGVNAVLIKIAAIGLKPIHLGKSIGQMYPFLCKMVTTNLDNEYIMSIVH